MNKVKVKESKIHGLGLFADQEFNEGDMIGLAHYNGVPSEIIGKYHNHSDKPNAHSITVGNKRFLVALNPLMKGEEITVDYREQPDLEQPEEFAKGGLVSMPKPSKKGLASKRYSRDLTATNRLLTKNKLLQKPKSKKRKIYDPNAKYYQTGGESNDRQFRKELMKEYPGMQDVYGRRGQKLRITEDPNYVASQHGNFGNIEFMFPHQEPINYTEDYSYASPHPRKYNLIYNPEGANRGDMFLDMMHGMRDDENYMKLLENFNAAVRQDRGTNMDKWWAVDEAEGYPDGREQWDDNYIDGVLRSELNRLDPIAATSFDSEGYAKERQLNTDPIRNAAQDIYTYLKTKHKDGGQLGNYKKGGEPKKKKRDSKGRYRGDKDYIHTPFTEEWKETYPAGEWAQTIQEIPEVYVLGNAERVARDKARVAQEEAAREGYQRYLSAPHMFNPDGSYRTQAVQSADWLWGLGLGASSGLAKSAVGAAEALGTRALPYIEGALNTSIPGMASIPGATIGNAAAAGFAGDAIVNRLYPSAGKIQEGEYGEAAADIATGILDLAGANMISPLYKGARTTASELGKFIGTEEGLLSNAYKVNPFAVKENPEMFLYRTQPKNFKAGITEEEEIKSLITDKIIKGEKVPIWLHGKLLKIQNDPEPFRAALNQYHGQWFDKNPQRMEWYMKGRLDDVEGDILRLKLPKQEGLSYNLKNFPEAQKASLNYDTEFIVPREKLFEAEKFSTNDLQQLIQEDAAFNKPHWLRGYKEVPKELPGSPNSTIMKSGMPNPLALADAIVPRLPNPVRLPLLGAPINEVGPFTGSPLNVLPGYGRTLGQKGNAFRKFGNTMEHVQDTKTLSPKGGSPFRIGKEQIASEGNWAAMNNPWEHYPGTFAAEFDFAAPGSNLGYRSSADRNGVLITDRAQNTLVDIPITDPGLSFHRRLPFSNRYVPINKEKLLNNQFQLATQGGHFQSLVEKYGYGLAYAGLMGAMGYSDAVKNYNKYTIDPVINEAKKILNKTNQ